MGMGRDVGGGMIYSSLEKFETFITRKGKACLAQFDLGSNYNQHRKYPVFLMDKYWILWLFD